MAADTKAGGAAAIDASEDIKRVKDVFKAVDANGDGCLSFEEMKDLLKRCAKGELGLTDADLRRLYDGVDKNKNGKVEFDELVDFLCAEAAGAIDIQAASLRCQIVAEEEASGKKPLVICILGSTKFNGKDTEELVKASAKELASPDHIFVTGGNPGVQTVWSETCGDAKKLWHILPKGGKCELKCGRELHAGADAGERQSIFGHVGDVYLCFEGGPGVSKEARIAHSRGAAVVPLPRTGGASSGMFDFPAPALKCPAGIKEEDFNLLVTPEAPIPATAKAIAQIVTTLGKEAAASLKAGKPAAPAK